MDKNVDAVKRIITLTYLGNGISHRLAAHGIKGAKLIIRTGLSLQELDKEERSKSEGMQRQIDDQSALVARFGAMRDSLLQLKKAEVEIMAEAKAMEPGLRWLVVADLPGAAPKHSIKQVVAAHFVHYPDPAAEERMERWLRVRLSGKQFAMTVTADSTNGGTKEEHRRRRR